MAIRGDLLFELAVGKEGNIVVTQPAPNVYLVTFTSPPDNRLVTVCCIFWATFLGADANAVM